MSRHQLRLLLSSLVAIALIGSSLVMHWFEASIQAAGPDDIEVSLREVRSCAADHCGVIGLGTVNGSYPTLASIAFWCSILLVLAVTVQCGTALVSGVVRALVSKVGYLLGTIVFIAAFAAGFVAKPESFANLDVQLVVERTSAPLLLVLGSVMSVIALRCAISERVAQGEAGEHMRIERDARLPVTPLSIRSPFIATPLPSALRGTIRYAVATAELTTSGIDARRDDGSTQVVNWDAIASVSARRFPPMVPLAGVTFVDVVSTAGSTLRILPSTEITGHDLDGLPEERARAFVILVAAQCLDAKLDPATKKFADGNTAAQVTDAAALATYDETLA